MADHDADLGAGPDVAAAGPAGLPAPARAGIHVRRYFKFYALGTAFAVVAAFVPPVERVVPPALPARPAATPGVATSAPPPPSGPPVLTAEPAPPALGRASAGAPPPAPAPAPAPSDDGSFDPPPPAPAPPVPPEDDEAPGEECEAPGGSQVVSAARDLNNLVKGGGGPALDPVEDGMAGAFGCEAAPEAATLTAAAYALAVTGMLR